MELDNLSPEVISAIEKFIEEGRNIVIGGETGVGKTTLVENFLKDNNDYELFDEVRESEEAQEAFSKMKLEKHTVAVLYGDSPESTMNRFYGLITEDEELEFNEFKRVVEVIIYVTLNNGERNDDGERLVSVYSNQK